MSLPRFLTDTGLGYYRGGLPAGGGFDGDDAAMLAQYPLATSSLLPKLGAADMLGYLADTWAGSLYQAQPIVFEAADGATSVTDSRGKVIKSMTPQAVFSRLKVGGGDFHPDLDSVGDWNGKFVQYNDESLLWHGMYAGMRAKLFARWNEFDSQTPPENSYSAEDRDKDLLAWDCAVEGFVKILDYMHAQLPGSRWSVHLLPTRAETTQVQPGGFSSALYDHDFGQWGNSAASRWRGVGATGDLATKANDYADFWLNVAEEVYGPVAAASGWLAPRLYIDVRMRNWDLEFPNQPTPGGWGNPAQVGFVREAYMGAYSDQVDLCRRMAPDTPLYIAVCPHLAVPGAVATNDTNIQAWYQHMSVDAETFREQMRRVLDRCDGVSFWSGEDYNGRVGMGIGRAAANPANSPVNGIWDNPDYNPNLAENGIIKTRIGLSRRFPQIFGHLDLHPNTQAGEDAWRTPELWAEYTAACMKHLNTLATSAVLLGSAKQTTLTSLLGARA
jgi:hypothetical protein